MQIQNTNESLKDPPMFVHPGGGGKGIRPNQLNQQQQQQQAQQHHHQSHHQAHHPTHHQTPHQQHQQHPVQLPSGSLHHSNQASSQNSANSHPNPHQQQSTGQPPHQQSFQHLAYYQYPVSQIHQQGPSASGQNHPGQNASSNVGGAQLAPSPPTHTGGNGSQGGSLGGGGGGGTGGSNSSGNALSGGGSGRQGQSASNTMSHYAPGSTIIQAALPTPASNHYMPPTYILNHNNALMLASYSNSGAAAGQHTNLTGGQAAPMYQMPGQTAATHQQTLHNTQQPMQYYSNPAVATSAQASMHHQPHMRTMVPIPRQQFIFMRSSVMAPAHQQTAAASGNTPVHVGTQLQNSGNRGAAAGPTSYVPQAYCAPPIPTMTTPGALAAQPQSMLAASAIGAPQLQSAYGHLAGATGSTSSNSHNIVPGSGAVGPTSSSLGSEHTGQRPRPHAIPIINPITMETLKFESQTKSTTTAAVEIKAPPESDHKPAKTSTVTLTAQPATEAPTTADTGTKDTECATLETAATAGDVGGANIAAKDKIDQQMQTDAFVKEAAKTTTTTTQPQANIVVAATTPTVEAVQPCLEENDDTDADTPELEHDDEVVTAPAGGGHPSEDRAQTPSNVDNDSITKDCGGEPHVMESDTDPTTETDVNPMSQMDEQLQTVDNEQLVEVMKQQQKSPTSAESHKSTGSKQQHEQMPTTTAAATIAAGDKTAKHDHLHETEDSSITIQKKEAAAEANAGAANNLPTTNKEINLSSKTTKDQLKTTSTATAKMGVNTATTTSPPTLGNVNTSKKAELATAATASQKTTGGNSDARGGGGASAAQAAAAAAAAQAAANDDAFITVSNRKNRKGPKQQQQQQQQQQQHQQRTKDNQKKPQQHHQQSQQQRQHERSNSTTSNTSTNNNKSHNNNNTRNLSTTTAPTAAAVVAGAAPVTKIHLTDIHNANSSSIPTSVNNGNNNKQQQQVQPPKPSVANSNNNNVIVQAATKAGQDTKDIDGGKHIKSQEIAEQSLQPALAAAAVTTTKTSAGHASSKTEEQQQKIVNSSSGDDEEEKLKLKQQQQKQKQSPPPASQPASPQNVDAKIEETNAALKDARFGDFKENDKPADVNVDKEAAAAPADVAATVTQPDIADCSSNPPHSRPAVAAPPSKPNKGLHVAPAIQKHPKGKQNLRYSLDELKMMGKTEESLKLPVVSCQKGGCVASLFVARPNIQNMQHMQQQYQHISFNESMDFVPGKRRVGGSQRKQHPITTSCGNIAGVGGPLGQHGSIVGMTGGSVSVTGTSFARPMKMIHVNLSLNEEIKLSECENAWQPDSLRSKTSGGQSARGNLDDNLESVLKKVRGVLNKLTPENFDVLLKTMKSISLDTEEKMQNVMLLIFEKTISEPNFAPTYAKFCKVLFQEVKPESKQHFNSSLIKRIQSEFETNVNDAGAKDGKLQPLLAKLAASTDAKARLELQAEIDDQEYQFRRRAWGTVRFIGELYKLQSLTADRVMICIESLLDHGSEEKLEYMCKLLTTVGHLLETKATKESSARVEKIFVKINEIVKISSRPQTGKNAMKISSRVRFMMQDVIDLRKRQWNPTSEGRAAQTATVSVSSGGGSAGGGGNNNSHQQRRRQQDDKNNRNNYDRGGSSQRMGGGGGGGGGGGYGSNNQGRRMGQDNRDNYYNKNSQKSQYSAQDQSLDLKKLNFSRGDDSSQSTTKLGNSSMYMWRTLGRQSGGLLQNATSPAFGGVTASGSYSGSTGNKNSANNNVKSYASNPFQMLSTRESDSDRHQSSDAERPSASQTSASSSSNEGSDDDEKSEATFSSEELHKLINGFVEEYMDCAPSNSYNWQAEALRTWHAHTQKQHVEAVYYLLMEYLHLRSVDKEQRSAIATVFSYLLRTKAFDKKTFARAYEQFSEEFADVLLDVPNGWVYVFEFLGPLLHDRLLAFEDIWQADWKRDSKFTQQFVISFIAHFTKEFGANYVRVLWHKEYKLEGGSLFSSNREKWNDFMNSHGLQFIFDAKVMPSIELTSWKSSSVEKHVKRLEFLLKGGTNCDLAIDYINTNVNINEEFLKRFTSFLCCDYATTTSSSSAGSNNASSSTKKGATADNSNAKTPQLNTETFRKICEPLLRFCIDTHENLELACLDAAYEAIQEEYSDYASVDDLTCSIFDRLYDSEIIAKDSLDKWYRQRQAGGGSKTRGGEAAGGQHLSAQLQAFIQKIL